MENSVNIPNMYIHVQLSPDTRLLFVADERGVEVCQQTRIAGATTGYRTHQQIILRYDSVPSVAAALYKCTQSAFKQYAVDYLDKRISELTKMKEPFLLGIDPEEEECIKTEEGQGTGDYSSIRDLMIDTDWEVYDIHRQNEDIVDSIADIVFRDVRGVASAKIVLSFSQTGETSLIVYGHPKKFQGGSEALKLARDVFYAKKT